MKGTWLLVGLIVCLSAFVSAGQEQKEGKFPSLDELVKPARRALSSEEVEKMAKLLVDAISLKGWSITREKAIRALGDEIGHVAVIPILEKIARDLEEHEDIRATAVRAIAHVPDEQAVEVLISLLDEAEKALNQNPKDKGAREVYGSDEEMLRRLIALPTHLIDSKKSMAENYRLYWEKVKRKIDLRKRVFVIKIFIH